MRRRLQHDLVRLFGGVDERQRHLLEAHAFELGEQAVTEHFGRNTGPIRNKEGDTALVCHSARGSEGFR